MLSRVASDLYWIGRHIERAENIARLLDVTYRTSLLPYQHEERGLAWAAPWAVPLITMGLAKTYYESNPALSAEQVLRFMIFDPANPSSVFGCLRAARESARAVRGAITSEMYEEINESWLEMRGYDHAHVERVGVQAFCEWVKTRSHLFRGVTFGTMLRGEAYHFLRLGTHLERADNTARILDTKYHLLLPSVSDVGGAVDYYQWQSLLTSVSGFEAYRRTYSDVITPRRVAELLILRKDMPRSLHACMTMIYETLQLLCDERDWELERLAGELHARLEFGRTEDIMRFGLHEYLVDFLERTAGLGEEITRRFFALA